MARLKISKLIDGDPEIGDGIVVVKNGMSRTIYRAVLGWNHTDDSEEGLARGKLWCCVYSNSFQVYDQSYNRSKDAGVVVDCGHANFTMVRMFHPYWCDGNEPPKDMNKNDKESCRQKYHNLLLSWHAAGNGVANAAQAQVNARSRRRRNNGTPIFVNPRQRARVAGDRRATRLSSERARSVSSQVVAEAARRAVRRAGRAARRTDRDNNNSMFLPDGGEDEGDNDNSDGGSDGGSDNDGAGEGAGSQSADPASQAYSDISATAIASILSQSSPDPHTPKPRYRTGSRALQNSSTRNSTPRVPDTVRFGDTSQRNQITPTPAGRGETGAAQLIPALPDLERTTLSPFPMSEFADGMQNLGLGSSSRGTTPATLLGAKKTRHQQAPSQATRSNSNRVAPPSFFGHGFNSPRIKREVDSQLSDSIERRARPVSLREIRELHPATGEQRLIIKLEDSDSEGEQRTKEISRLKRRVVHEVIELD